MRALGAAPQRCCARHSPDVEPQPAATVERRPVWCCLAVPISAVITSETHPDLRWTRPVKVRYGCPDGVHAQHDERGSSSNFFAAEAIRTGAHRGVAGYLYGIAAECAVKAMMEASGPRLNDAFYKHFPELRTILRTALRGQHGKTLARFVADDSFMNN